MNAIQSVEHRMRTGSNALALAGLALLLLNSVVIVVDILLRALFSAPIDRLIDVSAVIYIVAAAACLPAATVQRRHITIRAFSGRVGPRGRAALEAFACVALLLAWGVIAYQAWVYAAEMRESGQTLSQIDFSVAPIWYFVAAAMTFNFLAEWVNLAHWLRLLATGGEAPAEAAPEAADNIL